MKKEAREFSFELLRPRQLIRERSKCPLIFIPVGPLEYHGPHLPMGVDALNATLCAREVCKKLEKGVVMPTAFIGTEKKSPSHLLKNLGFKPADHIVGMDFPSALWKSHYYSEHIFALTIASIIEKLIDNRYKLIIIINGHGARDQVEVLTRLSKHYSNTTDCHIVSDIAIADEYLGGHADLYETSLMIYYRNKYNLGNIIDLSELPEKDIPIHYPDFSIVDRAGFSKNPDPDRIIREDPRSASEEIGKDIFEKTVQKFIDITKNALKKLENKN